MNDLGHPDRGDLLGNQRATYYRWLDVRRAIGEPQDGNLAAAVIAAIERQAAANTFQAPASGASLGRTTPGVRVAWAWLSRAGQQAAVVAATLLCLVRLAVFFVPVAGLH